MEKPKILGPVMIPDFKMARYHHEIGFYETYFTAETIEQYKRQFHEDQNETNLSLQHSSSIYKNAKLTQSFTINENNRLSLPENFIDLPDGTWMLEYTFDSIIDFNKIVELKLKGFSIEGEFTLVGEDGKSYTIHEKFRIMNKISELLSFNIYVQGGSTEGAGRNEHGEAHFELKEKNSSKNLGKIFMPSTELWQKSNLKERIKLMTVHNGKEISKREKKVLVHWLEINNNENLLRCHSEWNEINKFNNRVKLI